MSGIYLDHAATTPLDERVLGAMLPYLKSEFGNPSSVHRLGQTARRGVEEARERVAATLAVRSRQVVFTSGATEADDQAVFAAAAARPGGLVVSAGEHAAVLEAARRLAARGRDVTFVPLAPDGGSPLAAWEAALAAQATRGGTALVAAMLVNNETGALLDVGAVAELAHAHGALFLCDAVQGYGVEEFTLASLGADFVTLSAHKIYGPKGAGALVFREGSEPAPLLAGGAQERGHRPGTHAVPAIVGLGAAAALAAERLPAERARLAGLQARFEAAAGAIPGVAINAAGTPRSVKHTNLRVRGADGETLLMLLDEAGVYASAGSACAAGSVEPSHVLLAMGLGRDEAKASVRFSYGKAVDEALVDEAASRLSAVVERARSVVAS
ncbi:MAG: cysteine desulfurase [Trueperaceae bacterium]|nr:cysteine desulfurase [Trueperaceae bacterium]